MKTGYFIAAAIAALLLATSCQKDPEVYIAADLVNGQTFNFAIPRKTREVVFEYNSSVASGKLLSTPDSPVPIYGNLDGTTWRVTTSASVINAHPDCSRMFWARTRQEAHSSLLVEPELNKIDFGEGFSTWNVTDMHEMFANCFELYSLDLSNFYTKNVTNMSSMFSNCQDLYSLDLSHFNMSRVTDRRSMCYLLSYRFRHCTITCSPTTQWYLENGTGLNTSGATFTWVRPTSK